MSIETWRKEFFPPMVPNHESSWVIAANHSLRKYTGLLKVNLKKHGLLIVPKWGRWTVVDSSGEVLDAIAASNCALCEFAEHNGGCGSCPLKMVGEKGISCYDYRSIYQRLLLDANFPRIKMVNLLKKAVKLAEKEEKRRNKTK